MDVLYGQTSEILLFKLMVRLLMTRV